MVKYPLMSRELCGYAGEICTQKCYLLESVELQAEAGGFEKRELRGLSGPIWPKDTWYGFMNNTISTAEKEGCLRVEELKSKIDEITIQKTRNNELI